MTTKNSRTGPVGQHLGSQVQRSALAATTNLLESHRPRAILSSDSSFVWSINAVAGSEQPICDPSPWPASGLGASRGCISFQFCEPQVPVRKGQGISVWKGLPLPPEMTQPPRQLSRYPPHIPEPQPMRDSARLQDATALAQTAGAAAIRGRRRSSSTARRAQAAGPLRRQHLRRHRSCCSRPSLAVLANSEPVHLTPAVGATSEMAVVVVVLLVVVILAAAAAAASRDRRRQRRASRSEHSGCRPVSPWPKWPAPAAVAGLVPPRMQRRHPRQRARDPGLPTAARQKEYLV